MAVDKNHQGKGCAFPECPSFGHLRFRACCFPRHCRWWDGWKRQEILWTFRIRSNKGTGHETCSFYRRYSKIILGSLWWQGLLIGNPFTFFGTGDRFNYFPFSTRSCPENRKNKAVSSKREPKRESASCFLLLLAFRLTSAWKISAKILDNQKSIRS